METGFAGDYLKLLKPQQANTQLSAVFFGVYVKERYWEHFYHQADIGVRGVGADVCAAFEEAAVGLMAVICEPSKINCVEMVEIERQCDDIELLFADWLNALIYEMAVREIVFGKFEVSIDNGKLTAKVWGEKADPDKHETAVEVKGATYTELSVYQNDDKAWVAQCVVDV